MVGTDREENAIDAEPEKEPEKEPGKGRLRLRSDEVKT